MSLFVSRVKGIFIRLKRDGIMECLKYYLVTIEILLFNRNTLSRLYAKKTLSALSRKYPFLPIVIVTDSSFPKNKNQFSEEEKWIVKNKIGNFVNSIWVELHKPDATVPKTFKDSGYSVAEIIELLDSSRSIVVENRGMLKNYSGKHINIVNNRRVTVNQPDDADKTIYIFGGCSAFGVGCADEHTVASFLQRYTPDYKVENYASCISCREKYFLNTSKAQLYMPGDILIHFFSNSNRPRIPKNLANIFTLDLSELFERPHQYGDSIFFDGLGHLNSNGQRVVAEKLFEFLKEQDFYKNPPSYASLHTYNNQSEEILLSQEQYSELDEYKRQLRRENRVGAIVMNCNPFTLGHRYLVEYASNVVDRLFVFVVEEDKSVFPFADRIELVRQGTADLSNVKVLPSGKFIISALTFRDYFGKDKIKEDITIDPSMDVELFARHIAPTLGISIRFAGEEPLDNLTRQYNNTMRKILPRHGIDFEVIPRKEQDGGGVISASRVRKLLETKDFDAIAKLVPDTTLDYLIKKFRGVE